MFAVGVFLVSLFVPGLGYWITGKPRLGVYTLALLVVLILLSSWSRLIVDIVGFQVTVVMLVLVLIGSAAHAALIELRTKSPSRNWKSSLVFAIACIALSAALTGFRGAVLGYESYRVPSKSMAPTLGTGDFIIVDTWRYRDNGPLHGDLVTFLSPGDSGVVYVKRVVGIPGDRVEFVQGQLLRNGERVDEPYVMPDTRMPKSFGTDSTTLGPGEYFLLGDNRNNSRDSRVLGPIPGESIEGRVVLLWYSSDRDYPLAY